MPLHPDCSTFSLHSLIANSELGNGAARGCIVDDSMWPTVQVRVDNLHTFWTKIAQQQTATSPQSVEPAPLWAVLGYIPPHASADYTIVFDTNYNNMAQFFVNASVSEDDRPTAMLLTVIDRALRTAGVALSDVASIDR